MSFSLPFEVACCSRERDRLLYSLGRNCREETQGHSFKEIRRRRETLSPELSLSDECDRRGLSNALYRYYRCQGRQPKEREEIYGFQAFEVEDDLGIGSRPG